MLIIQLSSPRTLVAAGGARRGLALARRPQRRLLRAEASSELRDLYYKISDKTTNMDLKLKYQVDPKLDRISTSLERTEERISSRLERMEQRIISELERELKSKISLLEAREEANWDRAGTILLFIVAPLALLAFVKIQVTSDRVAELVKILNL